MQAQPIYIDKNHELVERCKRGERQAYSDLYRLYSKAMFNVAMRILNDVAEAEDSLQEAFVDAFQKLQDFRGEASFGSWLKQIVINKALSQLRQRKIQWTDIDDIQNDAERQGGYSDELCEEDTYDEESLQLSINAVNRAIQQLPDGYRTVLSLYLLEGYDHEEISQILNVAESTTRTQYIRAKKKLLDILRGNKKVDA